MPEAQTVPLMQALNEFLEKQAMDSQPQVDNAPESGQTSPVSTGERSSENSSDVESTIPGDAVDGKAMSPEMEQDTAQKNKAPKADETGVNVPSPKDTSDDPGTSHPAQVGSEKYSSTQDTINGHNELLSSIADLLKSAEMDSESEDEYHDETSGDSKKGKNLQIDSKEQYKDDKNPDEADNGGDKADVMESTDEDAVNGEKQSSSETVTIKKAEYDDLVTGNELLNEVLGAWVGQQDLQKVAQSQSQSQQQSTPQYTEEQEKQAREKVAHISEYASYLGGEVADFVVAMQEKQSMDPAGGGAPVDPSMLAAAPAAPAGAAAPAAPAGAGAAAPEGAEEEISPEDLELLLQALAEQGVNPEELMALNPEDLMPVGPEAGGGEAGPDVNAAAAASEEVAQEEEGGEEVPGGNGDNVQAAEEEGSEEDEYKEDMDETKYASQQEKKAAAKEIAKHLKEAVAKRSK